MWFKDQHGRYWNSEKLKLIQVKSWAKDGKEIWSVYADHGYEVTLYTGSESDCRAWVENLVRTINKYKVGAL